MERPLYFDHAATTPVDPRVAAAMAACLQADGAFGNPGSRTHDYGREAEALVETARAEVAALIGCEPRELVWTSGATEADNLALKGAAQAARRRGRGRHLVTCATEHKAVLDTCRQLAREGWEITCLAPAADGLLDPERLAAALRTDTVLVSVMAVNNETGVIQDLTAIAGLTRARGILLHVDAAQAAGRLPLDLARLDVDLLSLSAHKLYGPKGVGALYVRHWPRARIDAQIHGGGQERGLRAGTLATHQIVGMGVACRLARESMTADENRISALRERLWQGLRELGGVHLHGHPERRVAGILNVGFEGVGGESLLLALAGLAVSSGSACTSASDEPSHVLRAMGCADTLARSSVRFSLGRSTTATEVDQAIARVRAAVTYLRALSPATSGSAPVTAANALASGAFAQALGYGAAVLDCFRRPRHAGRFAGEAQGVGAGWAQSPDAAERIEIQVQVSAGGTIVAARFRAQGSAALIAAGELAAEWMEGRAVEPARTITHEAIAEALALPPARLASAVLAAQAVAAALDAVQPALVAAQLAISST